MFKLLIMLLSISVSRDANLLTLQSLSLDTQSITRVAQIGETIVLFRTVAVLQVPSSRGSQMSRAQATPTAANDTMIGKISTVTTIFTFSLLGGLLWWHRRQRSQNRSRGPASPDRQDDEHRGDSE